MKKSLGIIGGMGPLATADLLRKIVELTDADTDQEHLHVYIDCNTEIPPRPAAILSGGEDPTPQLTRSARKLETMGADILMMACNTAHYFYPQVSSAVKVPVLNMLEETAAEAKSLGVKTVGLLATEGTVLSGVYDRVFERQEIGVVRPTPKEQRLLDQIIAGVKANKYLINKKEVLEMADAFLARGAEILILGCTELPVAFEYYGVERPLIDPTTVLAKCAILKAGARVR